jgi:hypothetical protein
MTETTTIQISAETKADLDNIKLSKEPYDRLIRRIIARSEHKQEEGWVSLRMVKEDYQILLMRQTWPICEDILRDSKQ